MQTGARCAARTFRIGHSHSTSRTSQMAVAEADVASLETALSKTHLPDRPPAAPASASLAEALEQSPFKIFGEVEDVGIYKWRKGTRYKPLGNTQASDFLDRITLDARPPQVTSIDALNRQLPLALAPTSAKVYYNKFPFDNSYLPSLYCAANRRDAGLADVDFVFGGSTMNFLATQPPKRGASGGRKGYVPPSRREKEYVATRVPGTKAVLVAKYHVHPVNLSEAGYQVERFATGGSLVDENDLDSFEHLQVIHIAPGFRTVVCAETDAVDADGNLVEVKSRNARYWGSDLALQMICSGSSWLYAARKDRKRLVSFQRLQLEDVISRCCSKEDVRRIEERLPAAMRKLKYFADEGWFEGGKAYTIAFNEGEMELQAIETLTILPPEGILNDVLLSAKTPVGKPNGE